MGRPLGFAMAFHAAAGPWSCANRAARCEARRIETPRLR